jgi:hypothetical protein
MTLPKGSASLSHTLHKAHLAYNNLTPRAHYQASQWRAQAQALPNTPFKPVAQAGVAVASRFTELMGKAEFQTFCHTPEVGGMVMPELPVLVTFSMFFISMIPSRCVAEYNRAPLIQNPDDPQGKPKQDLRAVRDVLMRDVLSMSLFVFALPVITKFFRNKMQRDGAMLGWSKNLKHANLQIMSHPWNPLKPREAYSYQELRNSYAVEHGGSEVLAQRIGACPDNAEAPKAYQQALKGLSLYDKEPALQEAGHKVVHALEELVHHQHTLSQLLPNAPQALMNQYLGRSQNHQFKALFALPALQRAASAKALSPQGLQEALTQQQRHLSQQVQQQLATHALPVEALASHPSTALRQLGQALQHVQRTGDSHTYEQFWLQSNNLYGTVDALVQAKGISKGTPQYLPQFSASWQALHRVADLLPQQQATAQVQAALRNPAAAQQALEAVQGLYQTSAKAEQAMGKLDTVVHHLRQQGKAVGPRCFGVQQLNNFEPRKVLSQHVLNTRSLPDVSAFIFVTGVIGYFPVWLNQVVTEWEYKLKHKGAEPNEQQLDAAEEQFDRAGAAQTATA